MGAKMSERLLLPEGFSFGVATAGYQIEGGFNGPGEPCNNWQGWELTGRAAPSSSACGFWADPTQALDRAERIGCDSFRMSVEWARIEPECGVIDTDALGHYGDICSMCLERGLEPIVTLHHFTHPYWLGEEFWLRPASPDRFAEYVKKVVPVLSPYCKRWITINEPNVLSTLGWIAGRFPPGRRLAVSDAFCVLDNLLSAHILAFDIVHASCSEATVTFNTSSSSIYDQDRLLTDLICARSKGIEREDLDAWIDERRIKHDEIYRARSFGDLGIRKLFAWASPYGTSSRPRRHFSNGWLGLGAGTVSGAGTKAGAGSKAGSKADVYRQVGLDARSSSGLDTASSHRMGSALRSRVKRSAPRRVVDLVYSRADELALDVVGFDWYDPIASHAISLAEWGKGEGSKWAFARPLWDYQPSREGLSRWCVEQGELYDGREIWVVENGMASRVSDDKSFGRADGWNRPRYLRENIGAVLDAVQAGSPISTYLHWSLVDNYEWGSYEPRFGIFGFDRRNDRWMETDVMGFDSAGEYAKIIAGLKAGDRSVLENHR